MLETQLGFALNDEASELEELRLADAEITLHRHFLSSQQADHFFTILLNETPWSQDYLNFAGKQVLIPRLQAWIGDASKHYAYSGLQLQPLPWSESLLEIKHLVEVQAKSEFNSVLLNYYRNGHDSVAWHSDDEKELGENPIIASLSLGVDRRFELKHRHKHDSTSKLKCQLSHGSLLVMGPGLQVNWQHQVPKQKEIVEARINLTFRKIIQ